MKSRNTRQKEIIEATLSSMQGFFSAQDLYREIRREGIGIATLYRYLNKKEKDRQLHSYICDKRKIYSNNSNSHCHYICQICGKKQHIQLKDIGNIRKDIKGTICHFQIDVHGVCEGCSRK